MRTVKLCFFVASMAVLAFPQTSRAQLVHVSLQSFGECSDITYSPELRSGCFTVPAPVEDLPEWTALKPPTTAGEKVFPPVPAPLLKPVYKNQARRLIAARHCRNCKFVSVQTAYGKALLAQYRQNSRNVGVGVVQAIVGFFVPWPFSIPVSALACAAVQVQFDAKEYREDYRLEPTQQQYSDSFNTNFGYCSGITQIREAKTFPQFLMALFSVSAPFVKHIPVGVSYAYQGMMLAQGARGNKPVPVDQRRQRFSQAK